MVLDIGAHIGTHTLSMSRWVGPGGIVHSYEPQMKLYQEHLVNMDLNKIKNVRAHFVALGDRSMRVSMGRAKNDNEGGTALGKGGNRVELRTLDSYRFQNVSFMKIDVEGAEYYVLLGAKQTITRNRPSILVEIWRNSTKEEATYQKVVALLTSLGYKTPIPLTREGLHTKQKPKRSFYNYVFLPNKAPKK